MTPLLANLLGGPRMGTLDKLIISGSVASLIIIVGMAIWYWRNRNSN